MICVDRLIASSSASSAAAACFDSPVTEVSNSERVQDINGVMEGLKTQESEKSNGEFGNEKDGFLRECRICQEEDEEQDMESPCACNGTLKVIYIFLDFSLFNLFYACSICYRLHFLCQKFISLSTFSL